MKIVILAIAGLFAANAQSTPKRYTFGDPSMSPRFQSSSAVMDDDGVAQFQDADVAVAIELLARSFTVSLENYNTSGPIKLDWNACSLIDPDGQAHRIIHSRVKFLDRESPMPLVTIPPGAVYTETLVPSAYVHYFPKPLYWQLTPLLPEANNQIGKTVTVFLPLQIKGATRNYSFRIKIRAKDVNLRK
jgi:hypothetical protein